MKRIISLVIALILMLSMFTGCSRNQPEAMETVTQSAAAETPEASTSEQPSEDTEAPGSQPEETESLTVEPEQTKGADDFITAVWPLEEAVTLTMFFQYNTRDSLESGYTGPAEYPCFIYLEELTNIHIDFNVQSMDAYTERFNLQMVSQDFDDMYLNCYSLYTTGGEGAYDDEVWIDLNEYIYAYSPNYAALLETDGDMKKAALTDSGLMMSFLKVQTNAVKNGFATRGDWLEELGLDEPATIDDWYEAGLAMSAEYNPKYVFTVLPPGTAFYPDTEFIISDDKEVSYKFYNNDDFYSWLEVGIKWYEAGLLSEDIILGSFEGMGINPNDIDAWASVGDTAFWSSESRFIAADESNGYNAVYKAVKLPSADDNSLAWASGIDEKYYAMMNISTACKDVDVACQWIDWFYSEEGGILCNYGMEGVTYYYDDTNTLQYTTEYIEAVLNNKQRSLPFAGTTPGNFSYVAVSVPEYLQVQTTAQKAIDAVSLWNSDVLLNENRYPTAAAILMEESSDYNKLYSDISTYVEEYQAMVLVGELDLASSWDEYNRTLEALGVQQLVDYKTDAYKRYIAR